MYSFLGSHGSKPVKRKTRSWQWRIQHRRQVKVFLKWDWREAPGQQVCSQPGKQPVQIRKWADSSRVFSIIGCCKILTIVPCAIQLELVVYSVCNSLYLLIQNSQSIPSPLPSLFGNTSLFFMSVSLFLSQIGSFVLYFISNIIYICLYLFTSLILQVHPCFCRWHYFFCSYGWVVFHCIYQYIPHFLYPFICQWTFRLLHVLAIVTGAALNMGVYVTFQIRVFSRCMPRTGIAGSYCNSIFSFLSTFHTVLTEAAPTYIPTSSLGGFPFSPPSPASIIIDFSMVTILTGVRSPLNSCITLLTLPVQKSVVFHL